MLLAVSLFCLASHFFFDLLLFICAGVSLVQRNGHTMALYLFVQRRHVSYNINYDFYVRVS